MLSAGLVAVLACASPPGDAPPAGCPAPVALSQSSNPLDRALAPAFSATCLELIPEDPARLCRRLQQDLLGRADDGAPAGCGEALDPLLRRLQAEPRYLLQSERQWRDALVLAPELDWRYLRRIFELVDALHRGALRYDAFVASLMAEPAIALSGFPRSGAFTVFLGRKPSALEAEDFGRLYALWQSGYRQNGPDNLDVPEFGALIDPLACLGLGGCRTTLFGGTAVEISPRPPNQHGFSAPFAYEEATEAERTELERPGALLAANPQIWEAAADRLLSRFLGWDDGTFFPRTPGVLLPRVRLALADFLASTGDLPAAERLVLSSWLYRQRAREVAEPSPRPVWAVGPLKRAPAETLLDGLLVGTGVDLGVSEPRYPLRRYAKDLLDRYRLGTLDAAGLERAFAKIEALLAPRTRFAVGPSGVREPDLRYDSWADLLGRPGAEEGVRFALSHETVVQELCASVASDPRWELETAMERHLGRAPSAAEEAAIEQALQGCAGDCAARAICEAVLGGAELRFY